LEGAAFGREVRRPRRGRAAPVGRGLRRWRARADPRTLRERSAPAPTAEVPVEPEPWDPEPPPDQGFWSEDQLGLLAELKSEPSAVDPCPDVPPGFLDVLRIPTLSRAWGKGAPSTPGEPGASALAPGAEPALRDESAYEPPQVEQRTVAGRCRPWSVFALIVAQAAWAAGFQKANRKAFVGDGSAHNWRLRERFFGSFVPILDFIHALSYGFAAATAGRPFVLGWECYRKWLSGVWTGEVARVIEEWRARQEAVGRPRPEESETSVRVVVARALGYRVNHQDQMKYDAQRKQGLPITSSLMESVVKQMNYRVKGSAKFWCAEGAEAIVQLRADHLSDGEPLAECFQQRQATATGQRRDRRAG